jgi:8-oxo-dGTP pyrophosphatase MutT (NUDIX family)
MSVRSKVTGRQATRKGEGSLLREAAVLVPQLERDDAPPSLVFIHRSKQGRHGDQIAFPGGRIEPDDPTPVAAALREFEEELGVDRGEVEVLGSLPAMEKS